MKILYGVQGTGNGHITRARHLAGAFSERRDISVDFLFSGRPSNGYFDMQIFKNFKTARGLTFHTDNGKICYSKTIAQNNLFTLINEIKHTVVKDYDLVINDFEPISAWAAKKAGVPSLSISHQAAFLHNVPKKNQSVLDRLITQYFAPTSHALGTHWYHFGYDIIPPFIAKQLTPKEHEKQNCDEILVYLPFEKISLIKEQLQILSDVKFVCFHPVIQTPRIDKNIFWQPLSNATFKRKLYSCAGVVSNGGFELATECLSLGKPLLVKPLARQYEQLSNAYTLKSIGVCDVVHDISAENIDDWLQTRESVKIEFPRDCNALVDWILEGDWENKKSICKYLWDQVVFPTKVKGKLDKLALL